MSRLKTVGQYGQSIWLDFIEREFIASGQLARMIEQDGICGVTSNPAIFQKAIGTSAQYNEAIAALLRVNDAEPSALFEALAVEDIQRASDVMAPVYSATDGNDGYVSLEVSPHLAADTAGTVDAARRLWQAVDRPNLMIKVPGTPRGIEAIRQLIGEGINVNVTLLFAREAYRAVAAAYIDGIAACHAAGGDVSRVSSVASFFISRIDVAIDAQLEQQIATADSPQQRESLQRLLGKVAIANAKLAYQDYLEIFDNSESWQKLARVSGARPQRLLWASTGTKNPAYREVVYMEELVGDKTVNTVPPATLDAFRDHGESRAALLEHVESAYDVIHQLDSTGISLQQITDKLLVDGLQLFVDADHQLMGEVARKRKAILGERILRQTFALGDELTASVNALAEQWRRQDKLRRLWQRDASLWTGGDEACWLDWLDVVDDGYRQLPEWDRIGADIRGQGFTAIVLIGMGGSSLGPEVLSKVPGTRAGLLPLHILDSTDPAQISAIERNLDIGNTLFIVASKSGNTLEPDILMQYFLAKVRTARGNAATRQFLAITDPGSKLEAFAREHGFRHIVAGVPGIGGRYSVLSSFGLVPAAVMGIDIDNLLANTRTMINSCSASTPPAENPGFITGATIAAAALAGRDKLTLLASPALESFGAWVEQLVAESTGKQGKGIVPVHDEPLGAADVYGEDRLFVDIRLAGDSDSTRDRAIAALVAAGHPVVTITIESPEQIAQAFFHWEMATAIASAVLGIHPFNQPDVEAAKQQTRSLMTAYERQRSFSDNSFAADHTPAFSDDNFSLYGMGINNVASTDVALRWLLRQVEPNDYVALLAYVEMSDANKASLQTIREILRNSLRVATCLGFGPRFLHSSGQLYKGGRNNGVFLQITADDANDLPIPERAYSFGTAKTAQALGDFRVLLDRRRRALHIHIKANREDGKSLESGLLALQKILSAVIADMASPAQVNRAAL